MIEGMIGMFIAVLIFIFIILFSKAKPNPTIAIPLGNFLAEQGFVLLDLSNSLFKEISSVLRSTAHNSFIVQMYKRDSDQIVVCWISDSDGGTNSLVAAIPKTGSRGPWIIVSLPTIKGTGANLIRKLFEVSGSKYKGLAFSRVESNSLGQSIDLYIPRGAEIPRFKDELINLISQLGNVIIRSAGRMVLVERLSINRNETWEQEARELLRVTKLLECHL